MSDMISLKMGVKFATSLNMGGGGGELQQKLCIVTIKNTNSGQTLHIKYTIFIYNKGILNKKT